ncbi:hypothetical protein OVY35_24670, partial [Salmonella enterica subsp. enterica serovar 1,4,[5],12:i:-]|nr:hypothetical protein [Salmonella enterica subsp. enterica serovar 1,4,[5],12:i:-]
YVSHSSPSWMMDLPEPHFLAWKFHFVFSLFFCSFSKLKWGHVIVAVAKGSHYIKIPDGKGD